MSHKAAKRIRKLGRTPASLYDYLLKKAGKPFMDMQSKLDSETAFCRMMSKGIK